MANETAVVTEDDLEQAFREDPKFGFEVLDAYFREQIFRFIKSIRRSLSPEDIEDVYQDAMMELAKIVRKPSFDPLKPMRIVNKVVKEKTIDFWRRRTKRHFQSLNEIVHLIGDQLKDTDTGMEWSFLSPSDKIKFQKTLDAAIDSLPPKQKAAALAYVEVFEDVLESGSYKPLADRIREMTGEFVTAMQAKSNWHEAKQKIAEQLARAGFRALLEE